MHTPTGPNRIFHNLPNIKGARIEDAYSRYMAHSKYPTAAGFVNWIDERGNRKGDYVVLTEEQYKKFKHE